MSTTTNNWRAKYRKLDAAHRRLLGLYNLELQHSSTLTMKILFKDLDIITLESKVERMKNILAKAAGNKVLRRR